MVRKTHTKDSDPRIFDASTCLIPGPQVGVSAFSSLQQLQQLRLYELGGVDDFSLVPAVSGLTRSAADAL